MKHLIKIVSDSLRSDAQKEVFESYYRKTRIIVYLHGMLEDLNGYDIATIANISELEPTYHEVPKDSTDSMKGTVTRAVIPSGIYQVKADITDEPCIGYFWAETWGDSHVQKGMICLESDIQGCKEAYEVYCGCRH